MRFVGGGDVFVMRGVFYHTKLREAAKAATIEAMSATTAIQERRKFPRNETSARLQINLLRPQGLIPANSVNFGEGGLCVRLEEMLEVRSLVRLQLTAERSGVPRGLRSLECTGRVAWVIQRLDLRGVPPFVFDVGIEFVDPPPMLRQLIAQRGIHAAAPKDRLASEKMLDSAVIHGRHFSPRLQREANHPPRWHLIVTVEDVPCFSGRYPSERRAIAAWLQFKRQQANR